MERPRPAPGAGHPAAGAAAPASGPGRAAHGLHRRLADGQGPRHRPPHDQRYHGGKKITGRGRHLAVDTEGWLLALVVAAASVSDKAGAKVLLIRLFDAFSTLKIMWADTGYNGKPLAGYARAVAAITVEVVARASPHSFQVLRRRWVVERTFGWLMRYRRLARDYERTTANSEAMIYWATVIIMTRRLARYESGQPPIQRWGGERPRPPQQTALSTGSYPNGVAVDPAARTVYVANVNSNDVSVIDEATDSVTATIPVGSQPYAVGVDPGARTVYVANAT